MKYTFIITCLLLFAACKQEAVKEPETKKAEKAENELVLTENQLKTFEITTVKAEQKPVSGMLLLNGKVSVDPDARVSISSVLGGHVKTVRVLPGQQVKKGEIIVTLEDQQFIQLQQDYLTTQAQLLSAAPDYQRQKELNQNKSASDKVLQQAETEYRSLLAVKSGLQEKLRLLNIDPASVAPGKIRRSIHITAPFNGIIGKVLVNKGRYATPSDELVEVINPQGLLLTLKVFEKDLSGIQVGQNLQAFANGSPDHTVQARIVTKGGSISEDGSTEVTARITGGSSKDFVDGLYINARLAVENRTAYTLPAEAVVSFDGKNYVFEKTARHTFRLHEVETGDTFEGLVPILNHVALLNRNIVCKGAYNLLTALKNKAEAS